MTTLPDTSKDRILNELLYLQITDNLRPASEQPEEWQSADYAELDDLDEVWSQYHDAVNMTASQLKSWSETEYSKAASLTRSPIARNLELLSTPKTEWTGKHIRWARKTIAFVSRMKEAGQGEPVSKDIPYSKRDISLKNWAYDPKSSADHAEVSDKYLKGTPHGSKSKREAEIKRRANSSSTSYKSLPGDDKAVTKSSGYTRRFERKYGAKLEGDRSLSGIATVVAEAEGVSRSALLSALQEVKKRGQAAWGTGHRPGASQEQWWRARVYSFAVGGKTRKTADADLWKKVKDASADFSEAIDFRALIDRVVKWDGLELGVEYLPGQVRFPGTSHSKKLRSAYGHIRGYRGNDKEAIDCYIHPDVLDGVEGADSRPIFAVSQVSPEDGDFDEYKVMIGWESGEEAEQAYLREMSDDYLGDIEEVDLEWLEQFRKAADFEETLDFARLKLAGNTQQVKNCVKGWPCGFTCLSRSKKNCKKPLEGQTADLQQWLEKSADSANKASDRILTPESIRPEDITLEHIIDSGETSEIFPGERRYLLKNLFDPNQRPEDLGFEASAQAALDRVRYPDNFESWVSKMDYRARAPKIRARKQEVAEALLQNITERVNNGESVLLSQSQYGVSSLKAKGTIITADALPSLRAKNGNIELKDSKGKWIDHTAGDALLNLAARLSFNPGQLRDYIQDGAGDLAQVLTRKQGQGEPPKPKLELKDVVTPADRAQYARQELELAKQSGDRDRISKWEAEAKRTRQAALEAEQQRLNQTQTNLFGVDEYSNLPLFNFAEGRPKDIATIFAEQATEQIKPAIAQWRDTIQTLITEIGQGAGSDREKFLELQERLPELYPQLSIVEFADVLGVAIAAAEGAGRYEVIEGLTPEETSFEEALDFARLKLAGNTQQVKNCTKGWPCGFTCLSRAKKNCKKQLEGQSADLQDWLEQQFKQALGAIAPAKPQPSDPIDQFRAEAQVEETYKPSLFKEHTISVDARIDQAALETALSQIQSEGAAERLKLVESIINNQRIQAVFNDGDSKVKGKIDAMFGKLEDTKTFSYGDKRFVYYNALAEQYAQKGDTKSAERYRKKAQTELASAKRKAVAGKSAANGYTFEQSRHVVVSTESKKSPPRFETTPEAIARTVDMVYEAVDESGKGYAFHVSSQAPDINTKNLMTYIHEVGHQVQWISQGADAYPFPGMRQLKKLTTYSNTNDNEHFAEHFALWLLDAKRYQQADPVGFEYIDSRVRTAASRTNRRRA